MVKAHKRSSQAIQASMAFYWDNLAKGKIGEDNSALLGAMMVARIQLAALSRTDLPEDKRRSFTTTT